MFTIRQAARLTGVPEPTLRTWERRYGVVRPQRTEAGYRLYGSEALGVLSTMRRLVDSGWAPAEAARALLAGEVVAGHEEPADQPRRLWPGDEASRELLAAAARVDRHGVERSLDAGFSLGSFEHVVETWLCPTLVALGDGWARGEIDVAGEHAASHAVLRRLSAAFEAAGSRSRGPRAVVGLPPNSRHELGALAFATALRRRGIEVLYLGPDVPVASWDVAVTRHRADAAVLAVVMPEDRPAADRTVRVLRSRHPGLLLAVGGAAASDLSSKAVELAPTVADGAARLDALLHAS